MTSPVATPTDFPAAGAGFERTGATRLDARGRAPELPAETRRQDPGSTDTSMEFSYDRVTRRIVIRIVSRQTGEIVRQIPPEEYLAFVARFRELVGAILDRSV